MSSTSFSKNIVSTMENSDLNDLSKLNLHSAINAIQQYDLWDEIKMEIIDDEHPFGNNWIKKMSKHPEMQKMGHTGTSMCWVVYQIRDLVKSPSIWLIKTNKACENNANKKTS